MAVYMSFMVRLWREKSPGLSDAAADWHSEIEHIQSGQRWTFNTLDELLAFLRRQAEHAEALDRPVEDEGGRRQ